MDRATIKQKLLEILEGIVGNLVSVEESTNLQDDLNLDSLDIATMAIEVQTEFKVDLKDAALKKLVLVKDLIDLIQSEIPTNQHRAA